MSMRRNSKIIAAILGMFLLASCTTAPLTVNKNKMELNMENSYTRTSKTSSETAENFVNKGLKNMVVVSDDYVGIESIGEMAIYGDNINVIGKAKDIRIEASGEIRMKGQKIHNN